MEKTNYYPKKPKQSNLSNAYNLLVNIHTVCNDFLELYNELSNKSEFKTDKKAGRELDLLRAALLFSSSGLDSFVKQLVRDSLYDVVQVNLGAEKRLMSFIEKKLSKNDSMSTKFLSNALISADSRKHCIDCLIYELTGKSLQSKDELLNVASYFDIPSKEIVDDFDYLKDIFHMRNQIAHEMDFDYVTNNRRNRSEEDMIKAINYIFYVSNNLLCSIDKKIVCLSP